MQELWLAPVFELKLLLIVLQNRQETHVLCSIHLYEKAKLEPSRMPIRNRSKCCNKCSSVLVVVASCFVVHDLLQI